MYQEQERPAIAYVLINCDLGFEDRVIGELKHFGDVKEIHGVFGVFDIIAKVESKNLDELRETITWQIRKLDKVRSALTLSGMEGQGFKRNKE